MLLDMYQILFIQLISYFSLFISLAFLLSLCVQALVRRRNRWASLTYRKFETKIIDCLWIHKVLRLDTATPQIKIRQKLIQQCGWNVHILMYASMRRLLIFVMIALLFLCYFSIRYPVLLFYVNPLWIAVCSLSLLIFLWNDKKILEMIEQMRKEKIIKEISLVSHQLMYYTNSHLNLHAKLTRCIPLTKTIRQPFEYLLNDWYQDAEQALQAFKQRVASEDADHFAETLLAIRLNESAGYYELLQQRIQDYKEKIELAKDSRKETVSYLLFVLAGIPIMNTFRVFMYPWIAEGQKLFNGLN